MLEKNNKCLNCGEVLTDDQNYCPNCGQQNTIKKLPFGSFIKDFLSNYFSFDTILSKTLYPFVFKPGKLTKEFNEGKRTRYINPIRLYLLFSLFFFFMVSLLVPGDFLSGTKALSDNDYKAADSLSNMYVDSLKLQEEFEQVRPSAEVLKEEQSKWEDLKMWAKNDTLSNEGFQEKLKSISINVGDFNSKAIRNFLTEPSLFTYKATRNLPILMFFLLPIFALILKMFYFRSYYYVEHVIHGLHLHSFAYFIYGLVILMSNVFGTSDGTIIFIGFIWVSAYTLFSMKKFYPGGWFKTIFKFLSLGLFYLISLFFGFVLELYLSLAFI